MAAFKFVQL